MINLLSIGIYGRCPFYLGVVFVNRAVTPIPRQMPIRRIDDLGAACHCILLDCYHLAHHFSTRTVPSLSLLRVGRRG